MREYPDYPEVDPDEDPVAASAWKTDPAYWQAHLDYSLDGYRTTERERYAYLREWEKLSNPRPDMMNDVEYLSLRVSGECHRSGVLASLLRLHELGCPEPHPDLS